MPHFIKPNPVRFFQQLDKEKKQKSKLISFSLWGNNPKYVVGAIRNVELAKDIYPDFVCRFYVDDLIPTWAIVELEDLGAQIVEMNMIGNYLGMFWRLRAINDADIVIVRDCDSRLNERERWCVDEWIKSDYTYHTIKDHPAHMPFVCMPGLSGFKKNDINWNEKLNNFCSVNGYNQYGIDYLFFRGMEDLIKNDMLVHNMLGVKRKGLEFCGKVYDEAEQTVLEHEQVLRKWLQKNG